MKLIGKLIAAAGVIAGGSVVAAAQQPGNPFLDTTPGIVIGGNASVNLKMLPKEAHKFLTENFKNVAVKKCKKELPKGNYEVVLRDGTEIDFAANGKWTEIEAADKTTLPEGLLKKVLHHKAYKELVDRGWITLVEGVERTANGGMKLDLDKIVYDEIIFDVNGAVIALIDD